MRRFDEDEKYECMKCKDSGQGKHPGMYCTCRFGDELLEEHQREDKDRFDWGEI